MRLDLSPEAQLGLETAIAAPGGRAKAGGVVAAGSRKA